ncbi:hypothetical protein GCM10023200_52040 [Actinomycetospora chlora]|uniref:Uncharacterized protein n=1 Tax=Actinomycetospora chlora TaxID=663608 RepID=A0ABP9CFB9_9PSEU
MEPVLQEWWSGVLAVERAQQSEPLEVIKRVRLSGLIDPEYE